MVEFYIKWTIIISIQIVLAIVLIVLAIVLSKIAKKKELITAVNSDSASKEE